MAKLIHIQASPRGSRSTSQAVSSCFIESYCAAHAGDTVDTLDLWQLDLPEIDGAMLDAAYAVKHGQPHSPEQLLVWQVVVRIADHFKSADKYLFSLPMWNFSIPYKLKHYIDLLVHRGLTFSFTPEEGYKGLVTGKPLVAVYARGGAYSPGTGAESWDQQSKYLKHIFGFIGFTDIREIFIEPTEANPTSKTEAWAAARRQAAELAAHF
jgi:FMN-dependent NADH-azoreductase